MFQLTEAESANSRLHIARSVRWVLGPEHARTFLLRRSGRDDAAEPTPAGESRWTAAVWLRTVTSCRGERQCERRDPKSRQFCPHRRRQGLPFAGRAATGLLGVRQRSIESMASGPSRKISARVTTVEDNVVKSLSTAPSTTSAPLPSQPLPWTPRTPRKA